MNNIEKLFKNLQNPALGGFLIYNVSLSYYKSKNIGLPLSYTLFVLPILLNENLQEELSTTRVGFNKFIEKITGSSLANLYSLNFKTISYKKLTLKSLYIAGISNLIYIDSLTHTIIPNKEFIHSSKINDSVDTLMASASKLGTYFATESANNIKNFLRISL